MNTVFNPVAMTGVHPPRREENRVNYHFKSNCEINETLRALCWLKRSLPTFNRLFNHTQLELCVCSFHPLLNTVAHSPTTFKHVFTNDDRMNALPPRTPLAFSSTKHMAVIAIFCFSALFHGGLCCPRLLCTFCFK